MKKRQLRKPFRARRKKSILRNRFFRFTALSSVFAGVIFYFFIFSEFFQVENIAISGAVRVSLEDVKNLVADNLEKDLLVLKTKNLLLANSGKIRNSILEAFPQVANAQVKKNFDKTISVFLEERTAVAKLCSPCFLIDENGVIFEESSENNEQKNFLKIELSDGNTELKTGRKILDSKIISAIIQIKSETENIPDVGVKSILFVSPERLDAKTKEGWKIYFNPQNDINWQLTKLKAVLEGEISQFQRKKLEYVDLRFGNLAPYKYR